MVWLLVAKIPPQSFKNNHLRIEIALPNKKQHPLDVLIRTSYHYYGVKIAQRQQPLFVCDR